MLILFVSLLITLFAAASVSASDLPASHLKLFESKIRPILAEHCYDCHNSVNKANAGLALDYRDAILSGSENGSIIEPGNPEDSVLIWALRHEDGLEMPSKAPKLPEAVINDFEEWVSLGAPDPRTKKPTQLDLDNAIPWETLIEKRRQWWSFQPLKKTSPPEASNAEWERTAIDRFLFKAMSGQGIEAQQTAPPEVLARRLHLILTGLPPEASVAQAFKANPTEETYQKMVDALLNSDAFGERWGRHWLDWYRYAESHGSEGDPSLPYADAYRSYIIRALNADVPYNQLLSEHIAGDLLKSPRINEQLGLNESAIGPAHFRMIPHGFGVTDAYGEQVATVDNQIDVLSKAMLGITVSCARCHNHKFDPISQKDFYRLYGIMASVRPGTRNVDTIEKQSIHTKTLETLKRQIRKPLADYWLKNVDEAINRLAEFSFDLTQDEKEWISDLKKAPNKRQKTLPEDPEELSDFMLKREVAQVGEYHPFAPLKLWNKLSEAALSEAWNLQIEQYRNDFEATEAAKRNAAFYADLRNQRVLDSWYQEGNGLRPKVSPPGVFAVATEGNQALTGIFPAGVYSNLLSDKHSGMLASPNHVADGDWSYIRAIGENGALRMSARSYPLEQGLHPYVTPENGLMQWHPLRKYKYWNGEQVHFQATTLADKPVKHEEGKSWFGVTEVIGGNAKLKELGNPLYSVLPSNIEIADHDALIAAYQEALIASIKAWRRSKVTDAQAQYLGVFIRFNLLPNRYDTLPEALASLFQAYRQLESEIPFPTRAPGIFEGDVVEQPLLVRGETTQESEPLPRQFLEVFDSKPYSKRNSGRLELAKDIIDSSNTLKSRVIVNRLWSYVFGRGIVATTDNFGRLGKEPSHPELLDYLALEFEKNGGSIKTALRSMVTSRAFRSSSNASENAFTKDPNNQYFSYFAPRRLDAEAIMDSVNSVARDTFTRGVYLETKRNRLDPFLSTFNLPIPTSTTSQRDSTNVPAQALAMLNGEFVQNAANDWARSIERKLEEAPPELKIESLFWEAFARPPLQSELDRLLEYYNSIEDSDTSLTKVAFALLNTKEFIYVY